MIVVPDENGQVAAWVADRIDNCWRGFGECTALGIIDDDKLVAGIVYHNYDPYSEIIECSAASTTPRWLTKPVLYAMFSYPFDQVGVQLLITRNSEENTRLHRQLASYGFDLIRIPRGRGRREAEMVWTMTDEVWRASRFHRSSANG